jgi:prepilin-type N-terminal cleavage/methylation domain-containing protein
MAQPTGSGTNQRGFTLIEMTVVIAIILIGSAVVIPVSAQMVRSADSDSVLELTGAFIQGARNRAIAERRNIVVNFVSSTVVQIERIEVPSNDVTVVDTLTLRDGQEFMKLAVTSDTPDHFGAAGGVNFTGALPVMFTSDGSLIDAAGDVANGTVFVSNANSPNTARAISITGITGLLRRWKWRGAGWQS